MQVPWVSMVPFHCHSVNGKNHFLHSSLEINNKKKEKKKKFQTLSVNCQIPSINRICAFWGFQSGSRKPIYMQIVANLKFNCEKRNIFEINRMRLLILKNKISFFPICPVSKSVSLDERLPIIVHCLVVVMTERSDLNPLLVCWIEMWWVGMTQWAHCHLEESTLIRLNRMGHLCASSLQEFMDVVSSSTRGSCGVQTRPDFSKRAARGLGSPTFHNTFNCCQVTGQREICAHQLLKMCLIKLFSSLS